MQHPAPLGLEEVLEERTHSETVRATETSVALQLTVDEMRGLLADNTDLVQGLFLLDAPLPWPSAPAAWSCAAPHRATRRRR